MTPRPAAPTLRRLPPLLALALAALAATPAWAQAPTGAPTQAVGESPAPVAGETPAQAPAEAPTNAEDAAPAAPVAAPAGAPIRLVDRVPAGPTLERDVFLSGDTVSVEGDVDGDVFASGQRVTITGDVSGSVFLVAGDADLGGSVGGSVYASAAWLQLAPGAAVEHSLYFAGLSLEMPRDSSVGRDVQALTIGAELAGEIGRDSEVKIIPFEILRLLMDPLRSSDAEGDAMGSAPPLGWASSSRLGSHLGGLGLGAAIAQAAGLGVLGVAPAARLDGSGVEPAAGLRALGPDPASPDPSSALHRAVAAPGAQAESPGTGGSAWVDWLIQRLRVLVALAIVALVLAFAAPRVLDLWQGALGGRPLASLGYGMLVGINGFVLAAVAALAVGAIGALARGLTMDRLAALLWMLGFAVVAAAFAFFLIFLLFVSQVVVAAWLGRWIVARAWPGATPHRAWPVLAGLVVLVLLAGLPYLGPIVTFMASAIGLGAVVLSVPKLREMRRRAMAAA